MHVVMLRTFEVGMAVLPSGNVHGRSGDGADEFALLALAELGCRSREARAQAQVAYGDAKSDKRVSS